MTKYIKVPDLMESKLIFPGFLSELQKEEIERLSIDDSESNVITDEEIEKKFPCEIGQNVIMEEFKTYDEVRNVNYFRRQGARWAKEFISQQNKVYDGWISIDDRSKKMPYEEDFLVLFDNGDIRRFYEENAPFALYTHWQPLPNKPSTK